MRLGNRESYYYELSFAHQQKEREEIERKRAHANMSDEEYWVEYAQIQFKTQFWSAVAEGRNPNYFEARISHIPGKGNVVWAVAKEFIENGFFLMLSNMGEQRILTRDLNSWFPNFPDNVLKEDSEYTISVYLKSTT